MENAIIACLFTIAVAIVGAGIASAANLAKAKKLSNTNARLRGSNRELLKACRCVAQHAERKNTITDRWDCKICGTLCWDCKICGTLHGDGQHHIDCPIRVARGAIANAEES